MCAWQCDMYTSHTVCTVLGVWEDGHDVGWVWKDCHDVGWVWEDYHDVGRVGEDGHEMGYIHTYIHIYGGQTDRRIDLELLWGVLHIDICMYRAWDRGVGEESYP